MLKEAKNCELYQVRYDSIKDPAAKDAFCYIVGLASVLEGYVCYPHGHGAVKDFQFRLQGDEKKQPFAFSVNAGHLLFYFRDHAVRSGFCKFDELLKNFDSAKDTGNVEWTVPLHNVSDVQRLWPLVRAAIVAIDKTRS